MTSLRKRRVRQLQEEQRILMAPARFTKSQRIDQDLQGISNVLGVSTLTQPVRPKKKSLRQEKVKELQQSQKKLNKKKMLGGFF